MPSKEHDKRSWEDNYQNANLSGIELKDSGGKLVHFITIRHNEVLEKGSTHRVTIKLDDKSEPIFPPPQTFEQMIQAKRRQQMVLHGPHTSSSSTSSSSLSSRAARRSVAAARRTAAASLTTYRAPLTQPMKRRSVPASKSSKSTASSTAPATAAVALPTTAAVAPTTVVAPSSNSRTSSAVTLPNTAATFTSIAETKPALPSQSSKSSKKKSSSKKASPKKAKPKPSATLPPSISPSTSATAQATPTQAITLKLEPASPPPTTSTSTPKQPPALATPTATPSTSTSTPAANSDLNRIQYWDQFLEKDPPSRPLSPTATRVVSLAGTRRLGKDIYVVEPISCSTREVPSEKVITMRDPKRNTKLLETINPDEVKHLLKFIPPGSSLELKDGLYIQKSRRGGARIGAGRKRSRPLITVTRPIYEPSSPEQSLSTSQNSTIGSNTSTHSSSTSISQTA